MTLSTKIGALTAIPVVCCLLVTGILVTQRAQQWRDASATQSCVSLAYADSRLITEYQKERGISGMFLNGVASQAVVSEQRTRVDALLPQFRAGLQNSTLPIDIVQKGEAACESLTALRRDVDGRMSALDSASRHTAIIAELLAVQRVAAQSQKDGELSKIMISLVVLEAAKEAAGQVRATLAATLSKPDALTQEASRRLVKRVGELSVSLNSPVLVITRDSMNKLAAVQEAKEWDEFEAATRWLLDTRRPTEEKHDPQRVFECISTVIQRIDDVIAMELDTVRDSSTASQATARNSLIALGASAGAGTAALLTIACVVIRRIRRALRNLVDALRDAAQGEGDLTYRLPVVGRDELSEVAGWFNTFIEKVQFVVRDIAGCVGKLTSTSANLSSTATQLASGAEETNAQASGVSAAAEEMATSMTSMAGSTEQMSANVQTVSAAIEEMTVSIAEVARSAEQASDVAGNAAQLAESSNARIADLGNAANEIGKVIEVIQDIAEQTNLLALNATIEAARAGEAGKGFAVVATEVKDLARQTAGATEDIRRRIEGIQGSTQETVRAIGQIGKVIQQVNEVSRTIAAAVEEQSITTKEIARSVSGTATAAETVATGVAQSATASQEITRNITGVVDAAQQTASGAAHTQTAGQELSSMAGQLQTLVGQFKV